MPPPVSNPCVVPPTERERSAYLTLLADEDETIYSAVRAKLLTYGDQVRAWLQPLKLHDDPVLRRRALDILATLQRQEADNDFLCFCLKSGDNCDLERGAWLLARTAYPDINPAGYSALLDDYASDLREQLDCRSGPRVVLAALNRYLFEHLGYQGNQSEYYDTENSYLNRVMDRRRGIPITLCLIYILVAQRLRLPVTGIGMPGHFLCRFQSPTTEYYIDAFNQGKLLMKTDCIHFLVQHYGGFKEDYLAPASPRRLLQRICANLHHIYLKAGERDEAQRMQRYIVALD